MILWRIEINLNTYLTQYELFGPVHFQFKGYLVSFLLLPCFMEIPIINANSVEPDQMPHSAASDLGLHCLPVSHLWDARVKWVNLSI